jgi:hypothetical protein
MLPGCRCHVQGPEARDAVSFDNGDSVPHKHIGRFAPGVPLAAFESIGARSAPQRTCPGL